MKKKTSLPCDIIDFHVHPYLSESDNLCFYKKNLFLSPEEAMNDLANTGIMHICGSVIRQEAFDPHNDFSQIALLNETALEIRKRFGSIYTPGFQIHPAFLHESLEVIEFMHKNGFKLIGELVPYRHGWAEYGLNYGSRELNEILSLAEEYHMILSYHTMPDQQGQMDAMISRHPHLIFVPAHPGEKENYLKHLDRMKRYPNVYLDLSGTGLFRYGMLHEGIRQVGAERFLFGTDYPITNPRMYVQAVLGEHISDRDRKLIFRENAQRILEGHM